MGIKLSAHQQTALCVAAGVGEFAGKAHPQAHIGKRTWHALKKKGVVECVSNDVGHIHWRLTTYGWQKLKEIRAKHSKYMVI